MYALTAPWERLLRSIAASSLMLLAACASYGKLTLVSNPPNAKVTIYNHVTKKKELAIADGRVREYSFTGFAALKRLSYEARVRGAPPRQIKVIQWDTNTGSKVFEKRIESGTELLRADVERDRWLYIEFIWSTSEGTPVFKEPPPPSASIRRTCIAAVADWIKAVRKEDYSAMRKVVAPGVDQAPGPPESAVMQQAEIIAVRKGELESVMGGRSPTRWFAELEEGPDKAQVVVLHPILNDRVHPRAFVLVPYKRSWLIRDILISHPH